MSDQNQMQQNIQNNLNNLKYFQSAISSNLKGIDLGGDSIMIFFEI
ncbi:MAG: hypothetical protein ACTHKJ_05650 [Candidatus Nitrosocosmicus sp.]